jgi:uncharacterized protein YcbX
MPTSEQNFLGVVQELWRYPVKSMLGERLTATTVTESGLLGDRAYALRDTCDGKIATAARPARSALPYVPLTCPAKVYKPVVEISAW